ncbi:hypothetical protein H8356DRAFT_576926 [Neocallimastix lanati (nom. inval.)]|uniref:Uncharacterized protein n=1 Tax=Neocallimastix californiae TaxID=1754190 RepID=A0A1Y2B0U0_9FUNG|nr:hypothetical protein H8356DRAFT_576926 [Neocallimastix sp. JGI-2020a]ORY28346.1 hypothetical protein LY90DRAFT_90480 [Neocallimastix californiae]|eukprot:ORY28346.1 hypothetical protein LY90DRAFT_90480 [Neocallimastix californiae]
MQVVEILLMPLQNCMISIKLLKIFFLLRFYKLINSKEFKEIYTTYCLAFVQKKFNHDVYRTFFFFLIFVLKCCLVWPIDGFYCIFTF